MAASALGAAADGQLAALLTSATAAPPPGAAHLPTTSHATQNAAAFLNEYLAALRSCLVYAANFPGQPLRCARPHTKPLRL